MNCRQKVISSGANFSNLSKTVIMYRKTNFFTFKSSYHQVIWNYKSIKLKHQWKKPEGYDTGIKIYNRIANENVPLIVLNKNFVKWYICGPTVYNVSHIGHASCYVRFDIINRVLQQFFGINPVIALGVTDIDDKIIRESFKLKLDHRYLAKKYEGEFFSHLNELNILPPSFILRVSDHIQEIIEFTSRIIERSQGYVSKNGNVYFDLQNSPLHWKLNPPPTKGSTTLSEGQKFFLDFALWKAAKTDEPYWESPWGKGRPGWHIECSAMASKIFGSQLDLHGGGIDLAFPHHENEEYQSCCYHDCSQWVNYWLHTGELQVQGDKMSKSLKNFTPIKDFLNTYTADNLRMLCFITQYAKAIHYCSDAMELPVFACSTISNFLEEAHSYIRGNWQKGNISEASLLQELDETKNSVIEHLKNDFHTDKCFQNLMQLIKNTMRQMNEETTLSSSRSPGAVAAVSQYISQVFKSFGFNLGSRKYPQQVGDAQKFEFIIEEAVNFRSSVREASFLVENKPVKQDLLTACDSFRNNLKTVGVSIKDQGKKPSTWSFMEIKNETNESQEDIKV